MNSIISWGQRWLRKSPGFTLAEMMVAMAVGSFVVAGVLAVMTQLFDVTATNSNYMAAFRQAQNSGDWISRDSLMTQQVDIAATALTAGVDDSQTTITVSSTDGFPVSGVIGISGATGVEEDELIQYSGKTTTQFTGCTRDSSATAHSDGSSVTVFVALGWTEWTGDQNQVIYNLKEVSRQLVRSHLIKGVSESSYSLAGSSIVGEAIEAGETSSVWDYGDKELTVVITAQIRDEAATRTYRINPRPLF
ncbi:type II secretion system protein J [Chloroflexota bacterium]